MRYWTQFYLRTSTTTLPLTMESKRYHWLILARSRSKSIQLNSWQRSDDERNDSFASTWIVLELSAVILVFAQRPLGHLCKADQRKDQSYKHTSHSQCVNQSKCSNNLSSSLILLLFVMPMKPNISLN